MKYSEFKPTPLFEVNMSPGNLEKLSKNINALVGMEFELVIPGFHIDEIVGSEDSTDVPTSTDSNWVNEFKAFFSNGVVSNTQSDIMHIIYNIENRFYNWLKSLWVYTLSKDKTVQKVIFIKMIKEFLTQNEFETREEFLQRAREAMYDEEHEWADAEEEIYEKWIADASSVSTNNMFGLAEFDNSQLFTRFLKENNWATYWDIYDKGNSGLKWPYWKAKTPTGEFLDANMVYDSFSQMIGKPVILGRGWHDAPRLPGHYIVEPDTSVGYGTDDEGLEFISPPQPIDEMIADVEKIKDWALEHNMYTHKSTGLHINVSVPAQQNLDYVKLVLFLGDNYILEQFDRVGNTYCMSVIDNIKGKKLDASVIENMFYEFQHGLNSLASKAVYTANPDRDFSINKKEKWIEFRSAGGDWMSDPEIKKVKNTILRTVVALDIATDPSAHKEEYYKKLYKLLGRAKGNETVDYFLKYSTGQISMQQLKRSVRDAQLRRPSKFGIQTPKK